MEPVAAAYLSYDGYARFEHDGFDARVGPWDSQRLLVLRHMVDAILLPRLAEETKKALEKKAQVLCTLVCAGIGVRSCARTRVRVSCHNIRACGLFTSFMLLLLLLLCRT